MVSLKSCNSHVSKFGFKYVVSILKPIAVFLMNSVLSVKVDLQGDEVFNEDNLLVPKGFGDDLAHVAFVQNSWDPTKWKDARIDGIPKIEEKISPTFTVSSVETSFTKFVLV